jgi:hypothetical protein
MYVEMLLSLYLGYNVYYSCLSNEIIFIFQILLKDFTAVYFGSAYCFRKNLQAQIWNVFEKQLTKGTKQKQHFMSPPVIISG